jgi:hypothetical protein
LLAILFVVSLTAVAVSAKTTPSGYNTGHNAMYGTNSRGGLGGTGGIGGDGAVYGSTQGGRGGATVHAFGWPYYGKPAIAVVNHGS